MNENNARNKLHFLAQVAIVYDYRLDKEGASARGVFWKNADGQQLRHEILLGAIAAEDLNGNITLNDLGCGYGAFFEILKDMPLMQGSRYFGYDIAEQMVMTAQKRTSDPRAFFTQSPFATQQADYSFVSGTYNMCLDAPHDIWDAHIKESLQALWARTDKALAFNLLDRAHGQPLEDLYYADKSEFVNFCALHLSPNIEVVDDYPLDEFTIIVRR